MKLYSLLVVVLALHCSTAFSLKKLPQRTLKSSIASKHLSPKTHSASTFLLSAEDSSDAPSEETKVVAAAATTEKKGALRNETTQLVTYLLVWYLGNVYCKFLNNVHTKEIYLIYVSFCHYR